MTTECSRSWQAEAALDGRLSRADSKSFRRHAANCDSCAREVRALETLHAVGQRLPILTSTPLEQRRLRQSMLRAANELALQPARPRSWRLFALGAVAAAALVLLVSWLSAPRDSAPALAAGAPTFQIDTSEGAAWSSLSRHTTVRLLLKSGWFEISVDKLTAGQRFILELPDGELEVKGTRFLVEVQGATTERVRVHEGRVALRLRGKPSVLLKAGDSWPPIAAARVEPPAEVPAPQASAGESRDTSAPASTEASRARARASQSASTLPAPPTSSTPPASPSESSEASDPVTPPAGDAFAQAMSAFSAGDFGKAERLFTAFERAHPADGRVEDATYLRAVARARRGDAAATRAIARDYLRRYPNGLRRAEAERLLR